MHIAIGADHGGFPLKEEIRRMLEDEGHRVTDAGAFHLDPSDDYPDFVRLVAEAVRSGAAERGILICGSGVGAAIAANKFPGVRASVCHDTFSARQGVEDDDMNVLCLGARIIGPALTKEVVSSFLGARFSGAERHARRVGKVKGIEREYLEVVMEPARSLVVFETTEEMHAFAAGLWAGLSREAVETRGLFLAAVSGGRTPGGFFRRLAAVPGLAWDRTHIFLVDERLVPLKDADSNFRLLREALLEQITIPAGNVHPVPVELGPEEAGRQYEETIRETVPDCGRDIPCFDLMVLGMGEDGHTASLFPGSEALDEQQRLVRHVPAPGVQHERITMTLPLINESRHAVFLVSGSGKAQALRRVMAGGGPALPAALVALRRGPVLYCADAAAAG